MRAVLIVDYDPAWPGLYEALRVQVSAALGPTLLRVEHVGSTAVCGLPSKPVIDLDAVVRPVDVPEAIRRLTSIGYAHRGDLGVAGREAFAAPLGGPSHHLYLCPADSPALAAHLRFRDALRGNRELAGRYGILKRELATRFGTDRDGYCEAKTEFIASVLAERRSDAEPGTTDDGP